MTTPILQTQIAEKSILDLFARQTYLGNSFILPMPGSSLTDTNEHPIVLIKNADTKGLFFFNRKVNTNNNNVLVKYYLNCTPNVLGSTTTPVNIRSGSANVSVASCYLGATITSNGTLLEVIPATANSAVADFVLIIDPGTNLLITATQETAGTTNIFSENVWYEI